MKAKKRQFHCIKCGSECDIYKKGRGHRLLVCPSCGILASNPLPLLAAAAAPLLIDAASSLFSKKKATSDDSSIPPRKIVTDSLDKPNKGERYVNLALRG